MKKRSHPSTEPSSGIMITIMNTISATIDAAGRLVVPKPIRDEAGLVSGMALEIRCRDGRIEIEPAPREVRIIKRGRVYVAEPLEASEPLTREIVRETQEAIRSRHAKG